MKKLFWLLLIAIPFLTGVTFANDVVPDNVVSEKEPYRTLTITTATVNPLPEPQPYSITNATEATVSTGDSDLIPTIDIKLLFFDSVNDTELRQKIILGNAAIGAINVKLNEHDKPLITDFWVPKDLEPEYAAMKLNAIDVSTVAIYFESINIADEVQIISKNREFDGITHIRAIIGINGRKLTGPIVVVNGDESRKEKKMKAAYAVLGKAIAYRVAWFTGTWQEMGFTVPDSSVLFQRFNGQDASKGTFLGKETDLFDYTGTNSEGTSQFRSIVERVIGVMKKVMIPIAIMLLAYSGIEIFVLFQDEEKLNKKVHNLIGILLGFLTMTFAVTIVDWVIFGRNGEILRTADTADFAQRGLEEVSGVFDMFTSFLAIIAIAFIVYNAILLIISAGEDGKKTDIKRRIFLSMMGLILIISIRPIIDTFTDNNQLVMPNIKGMILIVAKWLNFLLSFIGILAVIAMIYAGIKMIVHFGDDTQVEDAKKIIKSAAIGLILALSSWTLVYYFVFAGAA